MKNRDIYLSFEQSVVLLEEILPNKNWSLFLSKNLNGLTEGFATLKFDNNTTDVAYQLADLEEFAVNFGRNKVSRDEITAIIDGYLERLESIELVSELKNDIDTFGSTGAFFENATVNADGTITLKKDDICNFLNAIQEIAEVQRETGYSLTTLSQVFRSLGAGIQLSNGEATALSAVAISHAGRSYDNAERIHSIFN